MAFKECLIISLFLWYARALLHRLKVASQINELDPDPEVFFGFNSKHVSASSVTRHHSSSERGVPLQELSSSLSFLYKTLEIDYLKRKLRPLSSIMTFSLGQ